MTKYVTGSIRWVDSETWAVIQDAGHEPYGILSVEVQATRVKVNYDFVATKVSSVQVTPDEAFASAGVRVGASVGLSYLYVYFYMGSSTIPIDPHLLTKAGANVWITGMFDFTPEVP